VAMKRTTVEMICTRCFRTVLVVHDQLPKICPRCLADEAIEAELVLDPWGSHRGGAMPDVV
jgi:ribosomal protein L40E